MMRKLYAAAALGFVSACFMACLFPDLSGLQRNVGNGGGSPSGSGSGAGRSSGGGTSTNSEGTGASGQGGGGQGGTLAACELGPGQHGSKSVINKGFGVHQRCIDVTETTWQEYKAFQQTSPKVPASLKSVCGWKDGLSDAFKPVDYLDQLWNAQMNDWDPLSVAGVDWCDAAVYCAWAGKSMCGEPDDGKTIPRQYGVSGWEMNSEWYEACMANRQAGDGLEDAGCFPPTSGQNYFTQYDPAAECYGGMGLAHTVSNVWEWEDNCTSDQNPNPGNPATDDCRYRGWTQEYTNDGGDDEAAHCEAANSDPHTYRGAPNNADKPNRVGIRCCWKAHSQ